MKRRKSHVAAGLGFVFASVVVAGAIYGGLTMTSRPRQAQAEPTMAASLPAVSLPLSESAVPSSDTMAEEASEPQGLADYMIGTFAEGIASHSACEGSMWWFNDDGTFDYSGDDGKAPSSGSWRVSGGTLYLAGTGANASSDAATENAEITFDVTRSRDGIVIGGSDYISCAPNG